MIKFRLIFLFLFAIILNVNAFSQSIDDLPTKQYAIVAKNINVRKGPSIDQMDLGWMGNDEYIYVIKTEYDDKNIPWCYINLGGEGYWTCGFYVVPFDTYAKHQWKTTNKETTLYNYNIFKCQNNFELTMNTVPNKGMLRYYGQELGDYYYVEYRPSVTVSIYGWVKKSDVQ